jgi:hypothetical protein
MFCTPFEYRIWCGLWCTSDMSCALQLSGSPYRALLVPRLVVLSSALYLYPFSCLATVANWCVTEYVWCLSVMLIYLSSCFFTWAYLALCLGLFHDLDMSSRSFILSFFEVLILMITLVPSSKSTLHPLNYKHKQSKGRFDKEMLKQKYLHKAKLKECTLLTSLAT